MSIIEKRIEMIEKRLDKIEDRLNKGYIDIDVKNQIRGIYDSFKTLREIVIKKHDENISLRGDREFLIKKHKDMLSKFPVKKELLLKDVKETLVVPVKEKVSENVHFIRELGKQIIADDNHAEGDSPVDQIFESVIKKGSVDVRNTSKALGVHEIQILEWAKELEERGLIGIKKENNKYTLVKKSL